MRDAPIDMILGRHDVAQPDILVVASPGQISGHGIEGAPLLVVDPEGRRIADHRLEGGAHRQVLAGEAGTRLRPADWPDLTIPLADLWR
jgi:hypothetical protein